MHLPRRADRHPPRLLSWALLGTWTWSIPDKTKWYKRGETASLRSWSQERRTAVCCRAPSRSTSGPEGTWLQVRHQRGRHHVERQQGHPSTAVRTTKTACHLAKRAGRQPGCMQATAPEVQWKGDRGTSARRRTMHGAPSGASLPDHRSLRTQISDPPPQFSSRALERLQFGPLLLATCTRHPTYCHALRRVPSWHFFWLQCKSASPQDCYIAIA